MFSQFHPKATKSRSKDAFSFALRESQLLEKAAFQIQPFGLAFGFQGAKAKAKSQTKHTLDRSKIDKINELIDALNDKNVLLEKQEDLLYEEHDKFVEAQKSHALEVKRMKCFLVNYLLDMRQFLT